MASIKNPPIKRVITRRTVKRKPQYKSLNPTPEQQAKVKLKVMFDLENKHRRQIGIEEVTYQQWRPQNYKDACIADFVSNWSRLKQFKRNSRYNNNRRAVL